MLYFEQGHFSDILEERWMYVNKHCINAIIKVLLDRIQSGIYYILYFYTLNIRML
jgi:hypothetical protein